MSRSCGNVNFANLFRSTSGAEMERKLNESNFRLNLKERKPWLRQYELVELSFARKLNCKVGIGRNVFRI
ncbi:MAG: hypothetical protein ACTS4U_01275 [Candidatus Hodgkinia cicadicola]